MRESLEQAESSQRLSYLTLVSLSLVAVGIAVWATWFVKDVVQDLRSLEGVDAQRVYERKLSELESLAIDFDAQEWKRGDLEQRRRMTPRLVKSEQLIGLSEREVVELLGTSQDMWEKWWFRVPLASGESLGAYILRRPRDESKRLRGNGIQPWTKWQERLHAEGEASPDIYTRQVAPRIVTKDEWLALPKEERCHLMNAWCAAVNSGDLTLADLEGWDLAHEDRELHVQYELSPDGNWNLELVIRSESGVIRAEYGPHYGGSY